MAEDIITLQNITKTFHTGTTDVQILKGIDLNIEKGDFMIIIGPSGSGKSTLLHILLGLEEPTSGDVVTLNQNLYQNWIEDNRSSFRKQHIGMVYQQPNWIKSLTVIENVSFPLLLLGFDKVAAQDQALKELTKVGMQDWAVYLPGELSSGQQQKVSLARALVTDPEIIVADEPTGNLDFESGEELMKLLEPLTQANKTIIMVTHDLEYLRYAKHAVRVFDGKIVDKYKEGDIKKLLRTTSLKRSGTKTNNNK